MTRPGMEEEEEERSVQKNLAASLGGRWVCIRGVWRPTCFHRSLSRPRGLEGCFLEPQFFKITLITIIINPKYNTISWRNYYPSSQPRGSTNSLAHYLRRAWPSSRNGPIFRYDKHPKNLTDINSIFFKYSNSCFLLVHRWDIIHSVLMYM